MRIALLTDSYMRLSDAGPVMDSFRQGILDALTRLGHDVTALMVNRDYFHDRCLEPLVPDAGALLARDLEALRPQLIFSINRAGLCPEVLSLRGPQFASWYIDSVHTFPPELLSFGEKELVFFYGRRSIELEGAPEHLPCSRRFFLPLGADPRLFSRVVSGAPREKCFNIVFLGGFFSPALLWQMARGRNPAFYRQLLALLEGVPAIRSWPDYLRLLTGTGFQGLDEPTARALLRALLSALTGQARVKMLETVQHLGLTLYGGNWEAMVPEHPALFASYAGCSITDPELISSVLSSAAMTVNVTHLQSQLCDGLNLRVFEALSCGTLLLQDCLEGMAGMLEPEVDFLPYRTASELLERCTWALEHPDEASRIALSGRRAFLSQHTLAHRMAHMLNVLEAS